MAVVYATVTRTALGPGPKRRFSFYPETVGNVVTIAAENYEHAGPFEVTTAASGAFTIAIPTGCDQGGNTLLWKIVETPIDKIPGRSGGPLAAHVIGYSTINASIGYDDLIAGLVVPSAVTPDLVENVAGYATTAQTKAAEASGSAAAALSSAADSDSSADLAAVSEANAATSASIASTQAGIATTKASEASTSAATATTKASEASTSAATATTKAGEASTSASAAQTARTGAETARTGAETARAGAEAVGNTNDTIMAGVDNNAGSAFRVQQDARLSATFVPKAASATAGGVHFGTDPTVDPFVTIGNRNDSGGWPGTGSPAGTPGALAVYQVFGDGTSGVPIPKSTQAIFVVAGYTGPTSDDSAEAGSSSCILQNTGTGYTQTQQSIGWEAGVTVSSGVDAEGLVTGVAGRISVIGNADTAVSVRASAQADASYTGTIGTYYAFAQLATPTYGTVTNKWGLYVVDKAHSEAGLSVGGPTWTGQASIKAAGNTDSSVSLLVLKGPDSAAGDPSPRGLTNLSLVQGANQTRALFEARDSSGNTRFAIGATGAPRVAGVIMNFTDGGGTPRIVMDHATGIELKESRNIIVGTTGGSKIGTAATQKLGFWNATPVVQPSGTPAAATDLATALTLVNDLRSKLLTIGLVA